MEIREGEPQPTTAMKVGVGRERSEAGVIDAVRARMYSWQFCGRLSVFVPVMHLEYGDADCN